MTTAKFKQAAEAAFSRANPAASIKWVKAGAVTFRDGTRGFTGTFTASAHGYRTRMVSAVQDRDGLMVR